MQRIAIATRIALVLALCGVNGSASAEPILLASRDGLASIEGQSNDAKPARARKKIDLSRFSDGPRWVPAPRGRAQARALELGIGSHEQTVKLLRSGASAELRAVVPGERPRTLLWPVPGGHPGRGFGFTRKLRTELRHNGIDIGGESGSAIRAAEAGLVVYSDNTLKGYGNCVIVLHAGGLMTLYAHNLRNTVQPGWLVERGERIALLGATGYAWGPHLHFELRDGFRPRDPAPMIRGFHSDEIAGPLAELAKPLTAPSPSPTPPWCTGRARARRNPALVRDSLRSRRSSFRLPTPAPSARCSSLLQRQPRAPSTAARHAAIVLRRRRRRCAAAADGVISYSGPALPQHGDAKTRQTIVLSTPTEPAARTRRSAQRCRSRPAHTCCAASGSASSPSAAGPSRAPLRVAARRQGVDPRRR